MFVFSKKNLNNFKNKSRLIMYYGFFIVFALFLYSCKTMKFSSLKNGDLIFVQSNEKQLSGAISRVTKENKETSYDHIGIIKKRKNAISVYHATAQGGSKIESLNSFLKNHNDVKIDVFRLKKEHQKAIPHALEKASQMLGKPYNFTYILSDSSYYCSDFIERIFREHQIFELKPMTFKNPETGEIDVYWNEFYQKQGLEAPEGKLGCNPNGLSMSDKIEFILTLQNP